MKIPILNIYYLLSYAWNCLDHAKRVNVSIDDKTKILDLLVMVLISGVKILLKRGLASNYLEVSEVIIGVKGKLELSETIKNNGIIKLQNVCTMDEFSQNIMFNRIIVSIIYRLLKTQELESKLHSELKKLIWQLPGITPVFLEEQHFKKIRLNRQDKFYKFILKLCELIFEWTLPSEKNGEYRFCDFTRDERKMNKLFEAFVRNFYKRNQLEFPVVRREGISWLWQNGNKNEEKFLPGMETDITLENATQKIIIDTKYYSKSMAEYYGAEKLFSTNLYQMFSYLINQEDNTVARTISSTGVLLYPKIDKDISLRYTYKSHVLLIETIDLNSNWKLIEEGLLDILKKASFKTCQ